MFQFISIYTNMKTSCFLVREISEVGRIELGSCFFRWRGKNSEIIKSDLVQKCFTYSQTVPDSRSLSLNFCQLRSFQKPIQILRDCGSTLKIRIRVGKQLNEKTVMTVFTQVTPSPRFCTDEHRWMRSLFEDTFPHLTSFRLRSLTVSDQMSKFKNKKLHQRIRENYEKTGG